MKSLRTLEFTLSLFTYIFVVYISFMIYGVFVNDDKLRDYVDIISIFASIIYSLVFYVLGYLPFLLISFVNLNSTYSKKKAKRSLFIIINGVIFIDLPILYIISSNKHILQNIISISSMIVTSLITYLFINLLLKNK